jgi:adenylate cyclase
VIQFANLRRRDWLIVLLITVATGGLLAAPQADRLRNVSIDVLTWINWVTRGRIHEPSQSHAVVIALDEETYTRKPFEGTPSITWTREIGKVLSAVVDGGAKVVGFDIVFPTTIEQSEIPFDEETLGGRLRGFDRDFLRALARTAQAGKLVLGQVQGQERTIAPSHAQRIAVGHHKNIRPLNVYRDSDGIVRRVPLAMAIDGQQTPSMSLELAARALGSSVKIDPAESPLLGTWRIPGRPPRTLTLNFEGGGDDIPTYSLADLRECVELKDEAYFRQHFEGRAVLFGVLLDLEDRSLTSKRFVTGLEGTYPDRCGASAPSVRSAVVRDTIASVYIHATAINNLLRRDALQEFGALAASVANGAFAGFAALAALLWAPPVAALMLVLVLAAWTGLAAAAFMHALAVPFLEQAVAGWGALFAAFGYRFLVADREKRFLRRSFAFYLAPALIDRMLSSNRPPTLGGEMRVVSLYRSDLAGFTALAEAMTPSDLIAFMNEYLSAVTEIIDNHGGYVDRYIGDAVDGVFGAPLDDANHALHAVKAALAIEARLKEMNAADLAPFKGHEVRQRIGLHTGSAVVGNMGSRQRFNYTVVGDAANLASRLEGANKFYRTSIIASEATMRLCGEEIAWRELDIVRVVGREGPVAIFEPMAVAGTLAAQQQACIRAYAEGLVRWRSRDFSGAARAFSEFADADPPSSVFRARAMKLALDPPGPDWSSDNVLESK